MGRRFLLWTLTFLSLSFSQGIEELLKKYEEASELYKRTRRESLGHVIVFTREDLKRMQAYRLSDVLKSLRLFTFGNNRFGVATLNEYGGVSPIPRHVRLYINDHEVSSLNTGSPFLVWENFPLDVVDHIEIYHGIGAIELGNDPATVIIKIYTKEPKKENARYVRGSVSSRRGYDGVIYSAEELSPDFSYIFLFMDGADNRKNYTVNGQKLLRDAFYNYAFLGLYFKRTKLELGYGSLRRDPFVGFAVDGVAETGWTRAEDIYISLTAFPFEDRSIKFVLSLDNHRRKHYESSSTGLYIPVFADPDPLKNPKDFYEKAFFNKVDIYLSKEFRGKNNKLLTAVSYKLYNSDIDSRYYTRLNGDRVQVNGTVPFDRQEIYSLIIEDQFSLNPRNLIIGGIKADKYLRNGGFRDFNELIARIGYISAPTDNLLIKGFVARSYIPPYFYDVEISGRDLDPIEIPFSFTTEAVVSMGSTQLNVGAGYIRVEKAIVPDNTGRLTNSRDGYEIKPLFLDLSYTFDRTKLSAGYSTVLDPHSKASPLRGGYLRVLSSFWRLDTFAELVYRSSFNFQGKKIEEGYDLSAGASYRITNGFSIHLKGENLLNKATEIPYTTGSGVISFPVRERTIYLGASWVF